MTATGRRGRKMQHLSTAFLIIALVIAVNGGVTAQDDLKADQIADESKNRAVTIIDGPKYVAPPIPIQPPSNQTRADENPVRPEPRPEQRPPSKPPHPAPDQPEHLPEPRPQPARSPPGPRVEPGPRAEPRPRHSLVVHKGPPARQHYSKPLKLRAAPNSVYRFPRVIPLPSHHRTYYRSKPPNRQPLVFAASNGRPVRINKPPKFSVPVETINGIRADDVRPPKLFESSTTSTSTSTTSTTTQRPLRNKRIWPKGYLEKKGATSRNTTASDTSDTANSTSTNSTDLEIASATHYRFKYVNTIRPAHTATTFVPLTVTRGYRRVSRVPKHTTTTTAYDIDTNYTRFEPNDWVPIAPPYHPKKRRPAQTPISRRSDASFTSPDEGPESKRTMYLQSYGLVPVASPQTAAPTSRRKKMVIFRKRKRPHNPDIYSGYSPKPVLRSPSVFAYGELQHEASDHPRTITRIKHHHHHHHHRYIKTVEKPVNVPYRVEVPRPYPVPVEKKVPVAVEKIKIVEKPVPYPVQVEKRVPYPVQVAVPHPVPYKVIEKEYVPKPYPVVQHVPVLKHVEVKVPQPVPVTVEKRVPYPVEVQVPVPVDRPYPVTVEKRVPYPVPVKVLVPQPYPVEVKVKEPVEVVKHVPVRVPYPQPYPVKVPTPVAVPVEKRVPYPVEVEKKVPVPYKVIVPQKVEVEKRVPVYVPRIYPVEKKVPVPVKVPYPVKVPVYNEAPVYANSYLQQAYLQNYNQITRQVSGGVTASDEVTSSPSHVVTVHGNTGFAGFQSRSDKTETTSAESFDKTETTSAESFDKTETTSAESSDKTETTSAESSDKTETTSAESSHRTETTSEESSDRTETSSSYGSSDRTNSSSTESTTKTQAPLSPKGFETSTTASTSAISTTITSS